jgi:Tol biopolymer transport system component
MEWADIGPIWSPDSQYIVYFSSLRKDLGIWIMPGQGGEPKHISSKLQARGGVDNFSDYGWHPNGRSVPCVVDWGDDRGMWTIDIESGLPQKIPFNYDGSIKEMSWSPDGKRIAFSYFGSFGYFGTGEPNLLKDSEIDFSNIYTMSPEGGVPKKVTKTKEGGLGFRMPRWSPDGRRIACVADGRIWIVRSEGGEPQPITEKKGRKVRLIRWFPDGENIYFSRVEDEGQKDVYYSVSFRGGELRKMNIEGVNNLGYWGSLDISPDGEKIVYAKILKTIHEFWVLENFLPKKNKTDK